ncbi:hypothetical protein PV410_24550 [Streptomyces sp. PA03-5A]|nr:hypothetical protein [Streptomyces sp. PA03-5A]
MVANTFIPIPAGALPQVTNKASHAARMISIFTTSGLERITVV